MSRILVIDDSELVSQLLVDYLTEVGYEVDVAHDANTGFNKAMAQPPDLILLDVQLPDVTGFEALKVIRNRDPIKNVPVIMITGTAHSAAEKVRGFQTGADDYVTKPFEMTELVERIKRLVTPRSLPAAPAPVQAPFIPPAPAPTPVPKPAPTAAPIPTPIQMPFSMPVPPPISEPVEPPLSVLPPHETSYEEPKMPALDPEPFLESSEPEIPVTPREPLAPRVRQALQKATGLLKSVGQKVPIGHVAMGVGVVGIGLGLLILGTWISARGPRVQVSMQQVKRAPLTFVIKKEKLVTPKGNQKLKPLEKAAAKAKDDLAGAISELREERARHKRGSSSASSVEYAERAVVRADRRYRRALQALKDEKKRVADNPVKPYVVRIDAIETTSPVLTVPRSAVKFNGTASFVWRVSGQRAEFILIQDGRSNSQNVEIVSGLREKDWVVTATAVPLKDGMKVTSAETESKPKTFKDWLRNYLLDMRAMLARGL